MGRLKSVMMVDAFVYPFRGTGPVMLVIGTVGMLLLGVAQVAPLYGWLGGLIGTMYFAAFYLKITGTTVSGSEEIPDWPEVSDYMEDMVKPYLRTVTAWCLAALPWFCVELFVEETEAYSQPLWWLALCFGAGYFPMALLNAAVHETIESVLPHRVVPAIVRCLPSYLWLVALVVVVGGGGSLVADWFFQLHYVGWLSGAFLSFYFAIVSARMVGIIYRKNEEKLEA
jgi:hypothetical protein